MKLFSILAVATVLSLSASSVDAQPAKSLKHAKKATELRQAVFQLMSSNMGIMGAMAKGKIPLNAEVIGTNSLRLEQLSLMLADYHKTDTSKFDVKTGALDKIWTEKDAFAKKIQALTLASQKLQVAVKSGDEKATKQAIGGVGKTCGSCHDDFKKD